MVFEYLSGGDSSAGDWNEELTRSYDDGPMAGETGIPGVLEGELPVLCTASCLFNMFSDRGGLGVGRQGRGVGGSHLISGNMLSWDKLLLACSLLALFTFKKQLFSLTESSM